MPIRPGTPVDQGPPPGWTHLVFKMLPRLAAGDLDTLPRSASRTAARIRMVMAADVARSARDPGRFVLRRVGVGLCMTDRRGRDMVVASGLLDQLDVESDFCERIVLRAAEAELAKTRLLAATPTLGLLRGSTLLAVGGEHHEVGLFYALLAGPARGSLRVALWAHDLGAARPGTPAQQLVELAPSLAFDCGLHVRAVRLLGAVPVSWSFAMQVLPPGQRHAVSTELAPLLAGAAAGRPDMRALERTLRHDLSPAASSRPAAVPAPAEAAGSGPARSARTSTAG